MMILNDHDRGDENGDAYGDVDEPHKNDECTVVGVHAKYVDYDDVDAADDGDGVGRPK